MVFLDEVDALGQKRSQQRNTGGRGAVNQLWSEMDGLTNNNDGVFVLGATNHPWDVDVALRRPGRFDGNLRMIKMGDLEAAVREVRPSIGQWLETARNVAQFANQDGTYLLTYLRKRRLA